MDELQPFRIGTTSVDDITILDVAGYLDLATSPLLRNAAQKALADGARRMVLDLQEVGFIDSTGLGVIVSLHKRLPNGLALVTRSSAVLRVLDLTSLTSVLSLYSSTAEAVGALRSPPDVIDLTAPEQRRAPETQPAPIQLP